MLVRTLNHLRLDAKGHAPGWFDAVCAAGKLENDKLYIEPADWLRIRREHTRGLGDRLARIAQPIARAIDAVAGTDLQNCNGCAQRQELLNQKFPGK